jgi:hypothetical protein
MDYNDDFKERRLMAPFYLVEANSMNPYKETNFITFMREISKNYINFLNFKIIFILKFALADRA